MSDPVTGIPAYREIDCYFCPEPFLSETPLYELILEQYGPEQVADLVRLDALPMLILLQWELPPPSMCEDCWQARLGQLRAAGQQ